MQETEKPTQWMKYLSLLMVALGVAVRILQFTFYRPLWYDENALAYNLVNRSLLGLLKPLDYVQAAPLGFLIPEKLVIQVLGASTYTLRLLPLLAGIGSVFLVWALARRVAPNAVALIVGLFATSDWLIYYSNEAKQYSLDVFIAAGLLLMLDMLRTGVSRRGWFLAAALGALAVWTSHPSAFILAGGGFVLFITQPELRRKLIGIAAVWAVSFMIAYLLLYRVTGANPELNGYWAEDFFHASLIWNISAVFEFFTLASGLHQPIMFVLVIFGTIIGIRSLPLKISALFLVPIAFTYGASVLQKYPFNGRLLLFLLPGMMVVIGAGLQAFLSAIAKKRLWLAPVLCALLLLLPISAVDTHQTFNHSADTEVPILIR